MIDMKKWLTLALALCLIAISVDAQSDKELLAKLASEEQETVDALVLYPKEVRTTLMEASLYPELLVKLDRMQKLTSQNFQDKMDGYPKKTQELVWDLTRYPELIHALAQDQSLDERKWSKLLKSFPEVIHPRARKAHARHFELLQQVDELNRTADLAFNDLLAYYPPEVGVTFRDLLEIPEVLSILTENIQLTVLVGDIYKKDSQWIISKTDSMSLVIANKNLQELESWKRELESDPEAMEELQASAAEFSEEYGYDDAYYDQEFDDMYSEAEPELRVSYHYYQHYPYWYGYPTWYIYPRWRPYPVWWDWGFYYQSGRSMVIINFPSFYFSNWYFYRPHHHHRYPHLSNHYVRHYYGHRRSSSSVVASVNNWQRANKEVITQKWLSNDNKRVERFREFGQFESDRRAYNNENTKPLSQREFIDKSAAKYPNIQTKIPKRAVKPTVPKVDPAKTKNTPKTKIDRKPERVKVYPPKSKPNVIPKRTPDKKPSRVIKPKTKKYKIDNGTEFHKRKWERQKPRPKANIPRQSPKSKRVPSKTKMPKTRKPNN